MRRSVLGLRTLLGVHIEDEGVQRGPFHQFGNEGLVPKNLNFCPCDARVSANRKRGNRHVAFRALKDWFKDAPTVFATEFSPRGECECFFEGEEERQEEEQEEDERVQVAPNMEAGGSYPQATPDLEEKEATEE